MKPAAHWEAVHTARPPEAQSWYRPNLDISLAWIERVAPDSEAALLDAGGGASTLVDELLRRGYTDLTVLDIAPAAIAHAQARLGADAARVCWLTGDITAVALEAGAFDVWHDRALFHFLTGESRRHAYLAQVRKALRPGGHLIVATFAPAGPSRCSGRRVLRYDTTALERAFAPGFRLLASRKYTHCTPAGARQPFVYCCFQRLERPPRIPTATVQQQDSLRHRTMQRKRGHSSTVRAADS